MEDLFDKSTRSKIMTSIKSKNTKIEIAFRKELFKQGLKGYRIKNTKICGNPDIAYTKHKLAIFLDGDFWHGYNWKFRNIIPSSDYWKNKISNNIQRDKNVNNILESQGWSILRFWEHEIEHNIQNCINKVKLALYSSN